MLGCIKIYHRFQPGDIISFNNRRILHGRERFDLNGGVRHLDVRNVHDFKIQMCFITILLHVFAISGSICEYQ